MTDEDSSSILEPSAPEAIDDEDFVNRYRVHRPTSPVHSPMSLETIVPSSSQYNLATEAGSRPTTPASFSKLNDDKQQVDLRDLRKQNRSPGVTPGLSTPLESIVPNLDDNPLHDTQSTSSNNAEASGGELFTHVQKIMTSQ